MRLKQKVITVFFILSLSIISITEVSGYTWIFRDEKNDVTYRFNGALYGIGDYHDEVDIKSIELDDSYLLIKFYDVPERDANHFYNIYMFWQTPPFANRTEGYFGLRENRMETWLYNSTGNEITHTIENSTIYIYLDSLVMPIPEFLSLQNSSYPDSIYVKANVDVFGGYNYYDIAEGTNFTQKIGYDSKFTTIIFIGSLTIICLIITKKKKK